MYHPTGYKLCVPELNRSPYKNWDSTQKISLFHYNHCATIVLRETGHNHSAIRELRRSCSPLCYEHIMAKQLQFLYQCNIGIVRMVVRQLAIGSVEDTSRERHIIISEITPSSEI
jgi:hypothetical protein